MATYKNIISNPILEASTTAERIGFFMFKPRDYQTNISNKASKILNDKGIVIINMEVRTGKTFTALMTCQNIKAKKILFVTKKKAISSIESDYKKLGPNYDMICINYESIHKIKNNNFDVIICDESHTLGAFPKASMRTKKLKVFVGGTKLILLTGTLTPESYSQIYHQLWISNNSPFEEKSFYKWAKNYVNVTQKRVSFGNMVNDYSDANKSKIDKLVNPIKLTYTQKEAGFSTVINEHFLTVDMLPVTYSTIKRLLKDLVIEGKNDVILADTPVKLKQKLHQLYSGTCKLESGNSIVFDYSKGEYIKKYFKGKKIAIFYKFKAELDLLKEVFKDNLCTDLKEFNETNKNIALQFVAGREGVKLSNAEALIFFNIDYSALSYFQAKDRMTTIDRLKNDVYWVFSKNGIEQKIYNTVSNKKDYTLSHFKKDFTR